ncbi:MAG TPA: ATP-binding protein, partial [Spirochaetia bacterium]|nr:ATP-binding protein [Spirochaetia bacterium]
RGPGIPERDRERIFERFYRLDRARGRELGGTGLGLAIVRHITLAHGGRVSLESREGEGSAFTVSVPAAGSAPSAGSGPASAQANEPSPSIDTARQ